MGNSKVGILGFRLRVHVLMKERKWSRWWRKKKFPSQFQQITMISCIFKYANIHNSSNERFSQYFANDVSCQSKLVYSSEKTTTMPRKYTDTRTHTRQVRIYREFFLAKKSSRRKHTHTHWSICKVIHSLTHSQSTNHPSLHSVPFAIFIPARTPPKKTHAHIFSIVIRYWMKLWVMAKIRQWRPIKEKLSVKYKSKITII